ncbi:hypothetical protein VTL71DRAFT_5181 [Oculimacula yallundae]|uniref:DUF7514 domain-containing protein n=1 Tax=Oculimacula yallundae TaxID=86028 RepID=A0ABR4C1V6_9HELO
MATKTQAPSEPEGQVPPPQPSTTAPDPKSYYGYLFEADKKPTKVLVALLRGIATYISESVGNTDEKALTPDKLASFYKAVGGNYDSLFVDVPHPSISWIYASIGCQHTLNQANDFSPPTVPALTPKGFVRWQSIEILLGPEEHVPFIQNAIRLFPIFNPLTGLPFPLPLPKEAFPIVPDPDIAKWHDQCAQELRQRASPTEDEIRPHLPPRPKVQAGYTHVRPPRPRVDPDYFEPKSMRGTRPVAYQHVSSSGIRGSVPVPVRPQLSRSPSHRARQFLAPEDTAARAGRGRRASFPENTIPSPQDSPVPPQTNREDHTRRHSHPRHARRGSMSEDASSSEDGSPATPISERRRRRRSYAHERQGERPAPPVAVRYSMAGDPPDQRRARERERGHSRQKEDGEGTKRRSFPSIPIDITGKLSAPFLLGKRDRERAKARSSSRSGGSGGNVRWKDLDGEAAKELWRTTSGGSLEEEGGRFRDDREREHKRRERERSQRNSYEDDARSSGHEGRHRHRERERDREAIVNGRAPPAVPDGRSFRERERDRERDRGDRRYVSPVRGVDGRRYPAHA